MPSFRYRALTQSGEMVSGSLTAPTAAEVANRIEYLGLVPVETITESGGAEKTRLSWSLLSRPKPEDVTVFTRDLALLLKAGARIDDALDLLAVDIDIGRLRPIVAQIRGRVLAGESLSEALLHHPTLFPPMYVALVRVGETSGALDHVLEVLGSERSRGEAMRRKVMDALRYPAFVLFAACAVLSFFLLFVLPQFAAVLQDFNAKLDPIVAALFDLSKFTRAHLEIIEAAIAVLILVGWLTFRRPALRSRIADIFTRLPLLRSVVQLNRTALFCRNLGILLGSGVPLTMTLRILVDMIGGAITAASGVRRWTGSGTGKTIGRARRHDPAAGYGHPYVADRRGNRSVAGARRQRRRILRSQAATQSRPRCRHHGAAGDHRDQHHRWRTDRIRDDRAALGHAGH